MSIPNGYELDAQQLTDSFIDSNDYFPLSFAQQRLWFLSQMEGGASEAYHISFGLRLKGDLDGAALREALDRIVCRHEALRTTFAFVDEQPVQRIAAVEDSGFLLIEHDLSGHSEAEAELARLAGEEASSAFDLERGPLIRGRLIRLSEDEHALLLTMHHIVADGWSMGVLVNELSALYAAFLRGEEDPLLPLEIQYADYAVWQREWIEGEVLQQQAAYWKTALADVPALLELPADHPRPAQKDYAGAFAPLMLDEQLTAGLRALSRRHGATLYMTLLAGWGVLLSRLSGQQDVVVGTPTANRGRAEIERLIGFFVNTLAVRLDLSGLPSVAEVLQRVKTQAVAAQHHQDIPFEQVVEILQPVRSLSHSPLFQVMLAWQNNEPGTLELPGLQLLPLGVGNHVVSKFDLTLFLQEEGNTILGGLEYATSLFERETIERYLGYFRKLLEAMVADETGSIDLLPMLSAAERNRVLYEWNDTKTEYPSDQCVHELFEAQVERTPAAVAVVFEDEELSYGELNLRANRLAHYLRELGVKPDDRVAICVERGFEMIIGLLGVLKAGGAYVPLDPTYPVERLRFMLEDSAPVALLTQSRLQNLFEDLQLPIVELDDENAAWRNQPDSNPDPHSIGLNSSHLAYVIYTSGSTGAPKGVMVQHASLVNFLYSIERTLSFEPIDSLLSVTTFSFDIAALEFYSPLIVGARVVMAGQHISSDPAGLIRSLQRGITVLQATPATWRMLFEAGWKNTTAVKALCGGEALSRSLSESLFTHSSLAWNLYGPTETTVWSLMKRLSDSRGPISIGRPIANTQVYILDVHGEPVPVGVAGEMYIGGAGVARGYLNRADLTAERFLPDPFSTEPDARMYRTGDLGRWLSDGNIEFLGRNDFQVKIRGFRIELGEIESRLLEHPVVREAVVVAREDVPGDKRLVAYYTVAVTDGLEQDALSAQQLRAHLSALLPEHMVPAAYVELESLPLTANGKLDRRSLPAPEQDAYATRGYESPRGEIEEKLAAVWAEVLELDGIGRHDHFFELGGHSLLAVRVVSRIRQELSAEVAVRDLFAHPELADLASVLEGAVPVQLPPILPAARSASLPLSFAQQRLWFLSQMEGGASEAYHIPFGLRLKGDLDGAALHKALDRIVCRHEALRTTFAFVDKQPVQRIAAVEDSGFLLIEHDLSGHSEAEAELARLAGEEASSAFDLERGPLIRGRLIRLSEDEHALLLTMHHIVADGWSMGVLVNELSALYAAFLRGEEDPLLPLEIQYADYAVWQREWIEGEVLQQQAAYWKTALADVPALLELPADHPRPAQKDYAGAFAPLMLDEQLTAGLRALSRRHGATLYMTLLAGWGALLSRLSGQQDVVVGTPTANRGRAEIERLIGFFVNTLAVRLDLSGSPSVAEVLQRVKTQAVAAQHHQDIPFEQVVELAQPVRSLSHSPLFQVMFAWQNNEPGTLELPGLQLLPLGVGNHVVSKFDLTLSLREEGNTILGGLEYATSLFERETIERYLGYFRKLLEAMVADETGSVDLLPMLSAAERNRVLYEWNDTKTEYPSDQCVHELFEAQVERTPAAVAVVFEDEELSYGELNLRANRLAHYLRELGVKPDDRVAICVERGFEMIIGLLGVLKAGGAYVPLDPTYPVERLRFMLEDSAPVALLTQSRLQNLFEDLQLPIVELDDENAAWRNQPDSNPDPHSIGLNSSHLAYVIYTSGSTGAPKGVMVQHHQIVARLSGIRASLLFSSDDVMPNVSSFAFDISILEVVLPLVNGGRTRITDAVRIKDPDYLLEQTRTITVFNAVTSLMDTWCQQIQRKTARQQYPNLRALLVGGEPVPKRLIEQLCAQFPDVQIIETYGPTESILYCTSCIALPSLKFGSTPPIGRPIANTQVYILDVHGEPVPVGVAGEMYIGGAGVARGYLNRPDLTAERFVPDPFSSEPGSRMYRTGDLGRWLSDGNIEFLGRNDFQVKIRGFRIELGEIESRLLEHPVVREAVVVAREDVPGDKRLVAYYTVAVTDGLEQDALSAQQLRAHLSALLPEHMVPAAYVRLESLPLTANGKLDRRSLPAPEQDAYATRGYEPPEGETETTLAEIWAEVLKLDRVSRHDHFFELGGHSLLAVSLLERMRRRGFKTDVRTLFATPTLADLAVAVDPNPVIEVPRNRIPANCQAITPEMLPLVELNQEEIDRIVATVPGGAENVQDIYPLAPLQEGILFHHLIGGEGDPYLMFSQMSFSTRERLDSYLRALQSVIDRHDILRTAVVWEGLSEPVQVVWRQAVLSVEEIALDPAAGDISEQLYTRFNPRQFRIDLRRAPLLRLCIAYDSVDDRWITMQLLHHLCGDHTTLEIMQVEVQAHLLGRDASLPAPLPFRNLVAQARLGVSREEHEVFFRNMLGDVEEPTAPFGLLDVRGDGTGIVEAHLPLDKDLAKDLRAHARRLGVSVASLCHLAWARVLSKLSGHDDDVVFGTVLFGRMQGAEGADRIMGLFINTLPVRIQVGDEPVDAGVRKTHARLGELLRHEHAALALAQRCSAVPAPTPLFSALLNYRHSPGAVQTRSPEVLQAWQGMQGLRGEERTNYPLTLSVNDLGADFSLTALTPASIGALRICQYMRTALKSLVDALETCPTQAVRALEVLPPAERHRLLYEWNDTKADYPSEQCVHQLFEQQVVKRPDAVAVVFKDAELSYTELNARANRLAHYLRELGIGIGDTVAILLERSVNLVIAEIAILKCGAGYVPIDPSFPAGRQSYLIADCAAKVVLSFDETTISASSAVPSVSIDRAMLDTEECGNLNVPLGAEATAYVMYTSGSTGQPKGVIIPHQAISRLVLNNGYAQFGANDRMAFAANPAFDASTLEVWAPLLNGGCIVIIDQDVLLDPACFGKALKQHAINVLWLTVGLFNRYSETLTEELANLRYLIIGGDTVDPESIAQLRCSSPQHLLNGYGPTETTTFATTYEISCPPNGVHCVPIGRPIANTRIYILDGQGEPVPVGVAGELYIGGAGVARGYLNRPELTAEKFLKDPFVAEPDARIYRTGDLGRWLADGNIEFLGRNDFQVKIRGFRIELGEIESRLREYSGVAEAVVVAREDEPGDKRLVAYYTVTVTDGPEAEAAEALRAHLSAVLPEYMVPTAYVQLASLPLTPNGKVDRKALPAPQAEAYATRGYEPPRGEIEEKLAAVWAGVLKLDRVGRHDNFFELGGHSLLATQLINKIQTTFEVELSLRALLETATVARLAEQIDDSTSVQQIEVLLPIRKNGTLKPIFFVHPGGGLSQCYIGFMKYLDKERPIYGLQSRNFTASPLSVQTIEEMAVDYYNEIRKIQPSGPYHLAGWSIGGHIAFAVANVIQRLGGDVALLSLFDSIPFPSRDPEDTDPCASLTLLDFAYDVYGEELRSQHPTLQALYGRLRRDNRLPSFLHENHFPILLQNIKDASTQGQKFVPMKYIGDLLIFIATKKKEIDIQSTVREWQPYVNGTIRYHLIECNHGEMMDPIRQAEIASLLEIELKNLRAECGEWDSKA